MEEWACMGAHDLNVLWALVSEQKRSHVFLYGREIFASLFNYHVLGRLNQ